LETCCGYGYGPARKSHHLPRICKGRQRRTGHRKSRGAFTGTASLSPDEPIPGTRTLTKKRQLFPGSSVDVSEFGCVAALGPEGPISVSGLGNIDPIPFRSAAGLERSVRSRFGTDFSDPLGPTDPCSTAVHMEPFSNFSPQGSHLSICYYHQDLHRRGLQAGSRPAPSTHPAATLLLTAA
jgi:hypothetical protein